jgi:hypothetical protein
MKASVTARRCALSRRTSTGRLEGLVEASTDIPCAARAEGVVGEFASRSGAPHLRSGVARARLRESGALAPPRSADSEFGLRWRRRVVQAVGLQPAHQFVRSAECGQMAGIDDVGDDVQAFESQPAHELERE